MAEWISVKKELPKPYVSVLGHIVDTEPFPSVRECYLTEDGVYFPAIKQSREIDYWCEMPEPPKGKEKWLNG